ncbi:MAG: glycosyltransferase family A protein [Rhodothermales bacterium]|nr:glycosyltransferase family A protein [Rhodothermales bacterium]
MSDASHTAGDAGADALPLVSVVVIFLDPGPFLDEAVASVRAQTYPRWELLLVDDGSTDGASERARRWAAADPGRVRYVEHDGHANRGMSASRNAGVGASRGSLVAFLDADDAWERGKLAAQVALLERHPEAGMVCGPTRFWYRWDGAPADAPPDELRRLGVEPDRLYPPPVLLEGVPAQRIKTPATCSVLVRRAVFDAVGGFEEAFRGMYEDQAFFAKVYARAPVYVTGACLDRYRQHGESCCSISERAGRYDPYGPNAAHRAFLEWLDGYLTAEGLRYSRAGWALRKALWLYRYPALAPFLNAAGAVAGRVLDRVQSAKPGRRAAGRPASD